MIVVTMGSEQARTRDLKVTELLERGFAALPPAPVAPKPTVAEVLVKPAPRVVVPVNDAPARVVEDDGPPVRFSMPKP